MGRSQTSQIRVTRTERVMSHVPPTGFATRFLVMVQVRLFSLLNVLHDCISPRFVSSPFYHCSQSACNGTVAKNVVMLKLNTLEIWACVRSWSQCSDKTIPCDIISMVNGR